MNTPTVHFRYVDYYCDDYPRIEIEEWYTVSETPKGYWVSYFQGALERKYMKWVSKTSRKRYCHPTEKEAWESFKIRKLRQLQHLERKERNVRAVAFEIIRRENAGVAP